MADTSRAAPQGSPVRERGVDAARALHLDLTGRAVPPSDPVEGRRFVVEHYDAIAAWSYMRSRELSFARWVRSVVGVEVAAWFARDDLRSFVFMSIRLALTAIWRSTRRLGARPSSSALLARQPGRWARPRYLHNRGGHRSWALPLRRPVICASRWHHSAPPVGGGFFLSRRSRRPRIRTR
jgi:hypothetical protein